MAPDALSPQIYLPERQGSLQIELLAATRRAGRIPYVLDQEVEALVRELETGRPVLVLQNLRTRHFPVWHYSVLVGLDPQTNEVVLNTGVTEAKTESARKFLRTWDWADRWAMVVLKPGELPESPQALRYFQSVADFERVAGAAQAESAWLAASTYWPKDSHPQLALGNIAYKSGDMRAAARYFLRGLEIDPGDAVLENNLASALAAAGCPDHARKRLGEFLESLGTDSPWRDEIVATLDELGLAQGGDLPHCARLLESPST